jgi:cytochrome c oxidase subunit II
MNEPNDLLSMQLPSGSLWLPEAAALSTPAVDDPFWLIYWTCVVAFVLVVVPMFYFMWRYRRKTADQRAESQVDHNQLMEIAWSAIPTVFFVIIFVWGFRGFLDLQTAPANAMELRVTGQKWFWTVKYPDQGVTVSGQGAELVVPIDQPVKLVMTSTDVLHSYFVPNFRVKQDVIPWRYTTLWFQPTKIGTELAVHPRPQTDRDPLFGDDPSVALCGRCFCASASSGADVSRRAVFRSQYL